MLNDRAIADRAAQGMITPFCDHKCRELGPSYGLGSAGYDCRLGDTLWIARPGAGIVDVADPRAIEEMFDPVKARSWVLMPGMFVLGATVEHFAIPRDLVGLCIGKSTLRRLGHVADMTPLEPGWHGNLVLELNFTLPRPVRIHAGMGIAQIMFDELSEHCVRDYGDLKGKYQGQTGVVGAR